MKKNNRGSFIEIGKISLFDEKKKRNEIKVRDSLLTIIANYLNQGKSIQDGERNKKTFVEGIVSMYIYIYIIIEKRLSSGERGYKDYDETARSKIHRRLIAAISILSAPPSPIIHPLGPLS